MRAAASPFRRRLVGTTALAMLLATAPAFGQAIAPGTLPSGEDRTDLVRRDGTAMTVELNPLAPRSVINWERFDIGTAASVNFTYKAGLDVLPVAVLNRVVGTATEGGPTTITASSILGKLSSNSDISVFLVNQAGILFGPNASVSVGSLVASTRDIDPSRFLRSLTNEYRFVGSSSVPDPKVLVLDGDRAIVAGSADPMGFSATGVVALLAGRIETRGTINAGREVAIVAADDATLTLTPGSPLTVHIAEGTAIATPMLLRGTLAGGSVIVAATRKGLTDGLLDIDANLVATSATASDGGIKLVAGYTDTPPARITIAGEDEKGVPAQNFGLVPVRLGNTLRASGVGGTIEIRAKDGIAAQPGGGTVATLDADGGVLVRADAGGVTLGAVTSRLVSASANGVDILASAGAVSLGDVTARTAAGTDGAAASIVAANGAVGLLNLAAVRNATLSGTAVTVAGEARSVAGSLAVTATTGDIIAGRLRANGLLQATASGGTLGAASLNSDAGTVRARAATVRGPMAGSVASVAAGQDANVDASGNAAFGTVDAQTIVLSAGGALTASRLTGRTAAPTTVGVYALGGTLDVGEASAPGASVNMIATTGNGAVTSLNAGGDGYLYAAGRASLRGGGAVGRDLLVTGGSVVLGGAAGGGTQQAGQYAYYAARDGAITAASPTTGLTIRADAGGTGNGAVVLNAITGIDLGGVALVTGDPGGAGNTGNVGISLTGTGAPLTLGTVDANALRGVEVGEGYTFGPLTTTGAVTLGDTRLAEGLALSTGGPIALGLLAISGAGETLSVTGTGAANTITATGPLSAPGGVTVSAPGAVSLVDVTADAGVAMIRSTGATLKTGSVRGDTVDVRALGELEAGSVIADVGAATLASTSAGVRVGGATQAAADVIVDAPGAIRMAAVTSTGGAVRFESSTTPAVGSIEAGVIGAASSILVDRDAGIRFASAASRDGGVMLTSASGTVRVDGATTARTSVGIGGTSVAVGSVEAGTTVALSASTGSIAASGAIIGDAGVTLTAPGAIDVRDVTSDAGAVRFRPAMGSVTGAISAGAVRSAGDLDVSRTGGITLASAESTGGSIVLRSSAGAVTVSGTTTAATGVLVGGTSATLGGVTARGGAIDIAATTGDLRAGALLATGRIALLAIGDATIGGAVSSAAEVTAAAGADLRSTGALSAETFVRAGATGSVLLQDVAAGSGYASLVAEGGSLSAGAVGAGGYVYGSAASGVSLASAASRDGRVELLAGSGRVDVAGAITARDFVAVLSETGVGIGSVADTGTGTSRLLARRGAVTVTGPTVVGGALSVEGATGVTLPAVTSIGGTVSLSSSAGAVTVGRLAAGSTGITAAGTVRADLLQGGPATISAGGGVSGGAGGLVADVASLAITAGGSVSLADVTTKGDLGVAASGATLLAGRVSAGGDIVVGGSSVTLGSGVPLAQVAGGRIAITSTGGPITGLAGLTLRSDAAGAGGRDLTLRSGGDIAFASGTLIAGGPDRQSAVRLGAGANGRIALASVEARLIAAPGIATALVHEGPISIERVAARDTLALRASGTNNPLAIGSVNVSAGDLRLEASGTLLLGTLAVSGGSTALAGATVTSGPVVTRGLTATASSGSAVFSTIDAGAGGIAVDAATDLRVTRATAVGGVALASTAGDVSGAGVADGYAPLVAASTGGSVSVRANASDGVRGAVLLDTITAAGGIDLAGRTITAASLVSSGNGVSASTRRDGVAIADGRLRIGTIDAAGAILLETGNRSASSDGSVTLDRASSGGGGIAITTNGGGLGASSSVSGTTLSAPSGAIALAIDGPATGASATGRSVAIASTSLQAGTTAASGGPLSLSTSSGPLSLGSASANGAAMLASGGDLSVGALSATGTAIATASRDASIGALAAGGDATLAAGRTLVVGAVDTASLSGTATGGDIRLGSARVGGTLGLTSAGSTSVTGAVAAGGAYRIDAATITLGASGATVRQAGGEVTLLARTGSVAAQGSTTLTATRGLAVTATGTNGAIAFAPESAIGSGAGDVTLRTRGAAALGTVSAAAGAIRLDAADVTLTRAISAQAVTLTNVSATGTTRLGDTAVGNEAEFAAGTTRFDVTTAEAGLIAAPVVTIASGARDVVVGALALAPATGSTRFAVQASGRIDMLGRFVAAGSGASRLVAIGDAGTGTIRVAPTPAEGGRLLVEGAALQLSADRIGVGYDRDFLSAIDYKGTGLGVDQVTREYVARPTSTLYNASGLGAPPYADLVLVRSGTLRLDYGRYALIQNTGRPGEQRGVVIGTAGASTANGPTLRLAARGNSNTFALFGTIDGISSSAAALLGAERVEVGADVSPVASRINGCVIGSGGGCLNTSIAQPTLNLFDTSRAEIVRTADDLSLPFDPLIGTNNEALYLDPAADPTPPPCEGDKPCPTNP